MFGVDRTKTASTIGKLCFTIKRARSINSENELRHGTKQARHAAEIELRKTAETELKKAVDWEVRLHSRFNASTYKKNAEAVRDRLHKRHLEIEQIQCHLMSSKRPRFKLSQKLMEQDDINNL